MTDMIKSPPHYNSHPSGVECMTLNRRMASLPANAFKYLFRCGLKGPALADLQKAREVIERELGEPVAPTVDHDYIPADVWDAFYQWESASPEGNILNAMRRIWHAQFSYTPCSELQEALMFIDQEIASMLPTLGEVRASRVSLEDVVSRREFELMEQERDMALLELDRDGAA